MKVNQVAALRIRFLVPHEVIVIVSNGIIHSWDAVLKDGAICWRGVPYLQVSKTHPKADTSVTKLTALKDIWIQEPGLTTQIAGNGVWRGFGRKGGWIATRSGVEGWLPMKNHDARYVTVHFRRDPTHKDFCAGVEYRESPKRVQVRSDGGFSELYYDPARMTDEWKGCLINGDKRVVEGVVEPSGWGDKLTWELAGHDDSDGGDWFHTLGWPGGAGVTVQNKAPYYAHEFYKGMPVTYLWAPSLWRLLRAGRSIKQTLRISWPAPLVQH